MFRISAAIAALLLLAPIGGCHPPVEPCQEFDPPPGHKPSSCPSKPAEQDSAGHPAEPPRYCYRTLAQADCYSEPQPGLTGYLGSAPIEAPPPPAKAPDTGG